MPEGAVYVGRPTRWGNPFSALPFLDLDRSIRLYEQAVAGMWLTGPVAHLPDEQLQAVYQAWTDWQRRMGEHPTEAAWSLKGLNLACWCPLDQPCHADVLLDRANSARSALSSPVFGGSGEDTP